MQAEQEKIETTVRDWIETMVVGLGLCPFAANVVNEGELKLQVCGAANVDTILAEFHESAMQLLRRGAEATTLFIVPQGFDEFEEYLDLLYICEDLLHAQQLDDQLQLASFHPMYRFEGAPEDDPANYSNRAPYPIVHLLQEAAVSRAVDSYPGADKIAERNIKRLRSIGLEAVVQRSTGVGSTRQR